MYIHEISCQALNLDKYVAEIYNSRMSNSPTGRGRPPKASADRKSKSVLLRLGPSEKEAFGDAARLAGIPLAVWMRERLRRAALKELEEVGERIPFFD